MRTILLSIMLSALVSTAYGQKVSVIHYNIKELDSKKIKEKHSQINYVKEVLKNFKADIFSFNEIQYDYKGVPNSSFKTQGKNISKLLRQLKRSSLKHQSFHPANTGKNARKKPDGTYYETASSNAARESADLINFGVMPGQYSSAGAFKYKIKKEIIISDLKWKDFNPNIDLSQFRTASGENFPQDMPLFDKNFSDITLDVAGKDLHIILLHTVPSYHFGNKRSLNMIRNAEQLKFLEWYLTGKTTFSVKLKGLSPLAEGSYFIAMGDFNVGINATGTQQAGADTLKRLFKVARAWIPENKMTYSNESSGFKPNPNRLMLDYIVTSKNIKGSNTKIILPPIERHELGCKGERLKATKNLPLKKIKYVKVEYKHKGKTCFAMVNKDYYVFKQASDHYPLYGEFELR